MQTSGTYLMLGKSVEKAKEDKITYIQLRVKIQVLSCKSAQLEME